MTAAAVRTAAATPPAAIEPPDKLSNFRDWFLSRGHQPFIPFAHGLSFLDGAEGVTVYRQGQLQVQLWTVRPNVDIPDHIHPNVDSFEVYLGGSIQFRRHGEVLVPADVAGAADERGFSLALGRTIRVRPNDWHGEQAGPQGAAFWSIQRWLNDRAPTSVADDWNGARMGPIHTAAVEAYEQKAVGDRQ